jgi:hypothetical protein
MHVVESRRAYECKICARVVYQDRCANTTKVVLLLNKSVRCIVLSGARGCKVKPFIGNST